MPWEGLPLLPGVWLAGFSRLRWLPDYQEP